MKTCIHYWAVLVVAFLTMSVVVSAQDGKVKRDWFEVSVGNGLARDNISGTNNGKGVVYLHAGIDLKYVTVFGEYTIDICNRPGRFAMVGLGYDADITKDFSVFAGAGLSPFGYKPVLDGFGEYAPVWAVMVQPRVKVTEHVFMGVDMRYSAGIHDYKRVTTGICLGFSF